MRNKQAENVFKHTTTMNVEIQEVHLMLYSFPILSEIYKF